MKLQIVALRDLAADAFGVPNFVPSLGTAIRSFGDEVGRAAPDNMLHKHPEHFELYHLGVYDDQNAQLDLLDKPKQIAVGLSYATANNVTHFTGSNRNA